MAERIERLVSRWDRVNGCLMHGRVSTGPGLDARPAFVLVHGLSMSSRYLVPAAERLAVDHPVYLPDLPGFGLSEKPSRVLNTGELVEILAGWMDRVGIRQAVLLGNSYGCQLILEFTLRYPQRVTAGILVGPTPDPRARNMLRVLWRGFLDLLIEPVSILPILLGDYLRAGFRRTVGTLRNSLKDPLEEKLPRVYHPVLVVGGSKDWIAPPRWVKEAARLLPNGRLGVIRGAGHGAHFSAPQELALLARAFLREIPSKL